MDPVDLERRLGQVEQEHTEVEGRVDALSQYLPRLMEQGKEDRKQIREDLADLRRRVTGTLAAAVIAALTAAFQGRLNLPVGDVASILRATADTVLRAGGIL